LLFYEATKRIINKSIVDKPLVMILIAAFGLCCNLVMGKILHSGHGGHDHGDSHGHSHGHSHEKSHGHSHAGEKKKKNKKKMKEEELI
jgi:ABC-type nickel/cobalt efflux system permease component RcnA